MRIGLLFTILWSLTQGIAQAYDSPISSETEFRLITYDNHSGGIEKDTCAVDKDYL